MKEVAANKEVVETHLNWMKEAIERIEETSKNTNENVQNIDMRLREVELLLKQKDSKIADLDSKVQTLEARTIVLKFLQDNPKVLIIGIGLIILLCNKDFYSFIKSIL